MSYIVCVPDWALGANGQRATDVVALEHVHEQGRCLVYSSTLEMDLSSLNILSIEHQKRCGKT